MHDDEDDDTAPSRTESTARAGASSWKHVAVVSVQRPASKHVSRRLVASHGLTPWLGRHRPRPRPGRRPVAHCIRSIPPPAHLVEAISVGGTIFSVRRSAPDLLSPSHLYNFSASTLKSPLTLFFFFFFFFLFLLLLPIYR